MFEERDSAFHWCFTCECNTTRASLINGLSDSVDISYEGKFWWSGIANLLSIEIKNYIYITHTSKQFSHFLSLLKQYILIIYINTFEYLCKPFKLCLKLSLVRNGTRDPKGHIAHLNNDQNAWWLFLLFGHIGNALRPEPGTMDFTIWVEDFMDITTLHLLF